MLKRDIDSDNVSHTINDLALSTQLQKMKRNNHDNWLYISIAITDDTIFALMTNCPRLKIAILSGLKRLTSAPFLLLISGKYAITASIQFVYFEACEKLCSKLNIIYFYLHIPAFLIVICSHNYNIEIFCVGSNVSLHLLVGMRILLMKSFYALFARSLDNVVFTVSPFYPFNTLNRPY